MKPPLSDTLLTVDQSGSGRGSGPGKPVLDPADRCARCWIVGHIQAASLADLTPLRSLSTSSG